MAGMGLSSHHRGDPIQGRRAITSGAISERIAGGIGHQRVSLGAAQIAVGDGRGGKGHGMGIGLGRVGPAPHEEDDHEHRTRTDVDHDAQRGR